MSCRPVPCRESEPLTRKPAGRPQDRDCPVALYGGCIAQRRNSVCHASGEAASDAKCSASLHPARCLISYLGSVIVHACLYALLRPPSLHCTPGACLLIARGVQGGMKCALLSVKSLDCQFSLHALHVLQLHVCVSEGGAASFASGHTLVSALTLCMPSHV